MGIVENCKVRYFAPDHWGTLDWFQHFYVGTYTFNASTQKALAGAASHFRKVHILLQLAQEHAARLPEDAAQLEKYGYSHAQRGKELSALIESILLDLYSSVDCTRQVVTFIYRCHRGVKQSTRKFFHAIANGNVANSVPREIRDAFACADWYPAFRRMRDELTHSDVGSCHLDDKTNKVVYMHSGLGNSKKALVIEDIFAYIEKLVSQINQFIGKTFHYLNRTLNDVEVWQICGLFGGRVYSRWVRASEAKNSNSGRCESFKWFEINGNPVCPFMNECEAYKRREIEQSN